jgi:Spy/CpxP family protein refolding chaperone
MKWAKWANSPVGVSLIAAVVLTGAVSTTEAGQRHKWWESGEIRTTLDITDDQAAAIADIYTEARPVLRSLMKALDSEETELSQVISDMNVAEWQLTLQIDKTEAARSALSKKRILMIYHMRQELTAEQRIGLKELQDSRRREHRSSSHR